MLFGAKKRAIAEPISHEQKTSCNNYPEIDSTPSEHCSIGPENILEQLFTNFTFILFNFFRSQAERASERLFPGAVGRENEDKTTHGLGTGEEEEKKLKCRLNKFVMVVVFA